MKITIVIRRNQNYEGAEGSRESMKEQTSALRYKASGVARAVPVFFSSFPQISVFFQLKVINQNNI